MYIDNRDNPSRNVGIPLKIRTRRSLIHLVVGRSVRVIDNKDNPTPITILLIENESTEFHFFLTCEKASKV
jgi:hypothetical protein